MLAVAEFAATRREIQMAKRSTETKLLTALAMATAAR
jgi:hypothetical protein